MREIKELVKDAGAFEVRGMAIVGIGFCVMTILASAIWG